MDSQSSDVNALGDALHESLNIQHVQVSEPASDGHEGEEDIHEWKETCPKKNLIKSETFPYPKLRLPPNSSDEEGEEDEEPETISQGLHSEESNEHAYSRSISLPVSSHLFAKLVTELVYIYLHTHTPCIYLLLHCLFCCELISAIQFSSN